VIGTDISPTQPTWVPPNCHFELDDATKPWTYADNSFDYIHLRCMMGCIKDWVELYRECFRCLKPGGWIEHLDFSVHIQADDGSVPADAIWTEWRQLLVEAGEKTGQTFVVVDDDRFAGWMREAGFPDVNVFRNKIPLGPWPADKKWKEVGSWNKLSSEEGLEGYMLYVLAHVHGWKYEEVQVWLAQVRKAMNRKHWHAYYPCNTAWAQKPR
jgi:SAM-dependent methyltransferase